MIDSMRDPEAAELGLPGEDESASTLEDDLEGVPETLEELEAQQKQAAPELEAGTVRNTTPTLPSSDLGPTYLHWGALGSVLLRFKHHSCLRLVKGPHL